MLNRYYNEPEFQYAMKLLETDPYETKNRLESYISKHPIDYYARAYYVILLTRICMFKEAEEEYNKVINESRNSSYYAYNPSTLKGFKYNLIVAKVKILAAKEKYGQILSVLDNHGEVFDSETYKFISYYCRNKLGQIRKDEAYRNKNAYRFNQTINYSEEAFREHVKKHEADYNLDAEIPNGTIFSPDFPIDNVFDEIKKYIPSDKRLFPGIFDNVYYFKYDNCGRINNSLTNYFCVVCYHNTTNFITMYPTKDGSKLPHVDLNYLKEKVSDDTKDNRPSQIDKFNRRFGR